MVRLNDRLDCRVWLRVGIKPIARLGLRLGLVGRGNLRSGFNYVFSLRFSLRVSLEA